MKKIASYILIFVIILGIFIPILSVRAAGNTSEGTCSVPMQNKDWPVNAGNCASSGGVWTPDLSQTHNDFERQYEQNALGVCGVTNATLWIGCLVVTMYTVFYTIPGFLLAWSGYFFNAIIGISVNSTIMSGSAFLPVAWGVIRDLSNIFFILILIYIAVEMILGIGGHGVKKAIAQVIIMALLINFSMFFTKVVIDSSNIIALVFYNKIKVEGSGPRPYNGGTGPNEKDISGGMVSAFNPVSALTWNNFFEQAKKDPLDPNKPANAANIVPPGITIGLLLVTGAVMFFAAYAFFVAGVSFMGRFIELWVLIIFSPFAFMSSTIPLLKKVEYVGWDAWFHRLLSCAFMAPIFMFFMYFIFLLVNTPVFGTLIDKNQTGMMAVLLGIVIPAMILLILLLKATDFAKKGGGKFAETVMSGAKIVGGLALGAATGGAALLGTGLIGGGLAGGIMKSSGEDLKEKANEKGFGGFGARLALKALDKTQKATFDVRQTGAGKSFGKALGLDLNQSKIIGLGTQEGGFKGRVERKAKALHEESELYKTGKTDKEVEEWSKQKIADYDRKLALAKTEKGFSQEKFEAENGYQPKLIKTAKALNAQRMNAFIGNLGQSDLLGTLAYEMAIGKVDRGNFKDNKEYSEAYKKATGKEMDANTKYDEKIAKIVNDPKVAMSKMAIGTVLSVGGGGIAGGVVAGQLGAGLTSAAMMKTIVAGALAGGAGAYATKLTDEKGEGKFAGDHEKEHEKLHKVEERIEANLKAIEEIDEHLKAFAERGKKAQTAAEDHPDKKYAGMVTNDANNKVTINQNKVEEAIADLAIEAQAGNIRLKELVRLGKNKKDHPEYSEYAGLKSELVRNMLETASVTKLRTSESRKNDLKKQNIDLGESKDRITEKAHAADHKKEHKEEKEEHGGGHAAAPAHTPAAAPAAAPAGDGHGHS